MTFTPWMNIERYGVDAQGFLDYDRVRDVSDEVGATLLVDMAHWAGLVAAKRRSEAVRARPDCIWLLLGETGRSTRVRTQVEHLRIAVRAVVDV